MIETTLDIATADGAMSTFITHPELGGPHPTVILYMDAPGIREELRDFARRIATVGYYCVLPNLYYRDGGPSFGVGAQRTEAEAKRMFELMDALTNARILDDTRAMLAHIDGDAAAAKGPMGCVGYCMSGQYVLTVAGTFPERFRAMASLHGVRIITEHDDSPHKLIPKLQGEQYFGFAETDQWVPLEMVATLEADLKQHGAQSLVEVHPGTEHGFVFPARAVFHKAEAERNWERVFGLLRRQLG